MTKIRTLAAALLVSVAMLPIAASAAGGPPSFPNAQPVIVVNPPSAATNNFIVNPGDIGSAVAHSLGVQQPVSLKFTWDLTSSGGDYTVPVGKQLLIDYVTGSCRALNVVVTELAIGNPSTLTPEIFLIALSNPLTTETDPVFNHMVSAYFSAGTVLNVIFNGAGFFSPGNNYASCKVVAHGQLSDVP
jgi:hypothetical protein